MVGKPDGQLLDQLARKCHITIDQALAHILADRQNAVMFSLVAPRKAYELHPVIFLIEVGDGVFDEHIQLGQQRFA